MYVYTYIYVFACAFMHIYAHMYIYVSPQTPFKCQKLHRLKLYNALHTQALPLHTRSLHAHTFYMLPINILYLCIHTFSPYTHLCVWKESVYIER